MESVKIINVVDGVAFQSNHAFMSNMFLCLIKHEGTEYKSAEHFFSAKMARSHNRLDLIDDMKMIQLSRFAGLPSMSD